MSRWSSDTVHRFILAVLVVVFLSCANDNGASTIDDIPIYAYSIIERFPHDNTAYTQGLQYVDGVLYESAGQYGESNLRRVDLETGDIEQIHNLPNNIFAEGITVVEDRIIQLTWQSSVGYVYDRESFEIIDQFYYPGEGWGITFDGNRLIMSDGSSILTFLDPETYEEVYNIEVWSEDGPVTGLNELEYINGEVYANIYPTSYIARISPETGQVTGWINLTGLLSAEERTPRAEVLNGIAYDEEENRLLLTGKRWPYIYHVELFEE